MAILLFICSSICGYEALESQNHLHRLRSFQTFIPALACTLYAVKLHALQ